MGKKIVTKFTVPQRNGKDPDIVVTRTQFFPSPKQRTSQVIMKQSLTKKRFEELLKKAAQPLSTQEPSPEEKRTSTAHPSDGCTDTHRNQGKIEGKEG